MNTTTKPHTIVLPYFRSHVQVYFIYRKGYKIDEKSFMDMLYNLSALINHDELGDISLYKAVLDELSSAGYTTDRLMNEVLIITIA